MPSSFQSIIYQLSTNEDNLVFLPHSKQLHIFLPSFSVWGYLQLRSDHDLVFTLSWQESATDSHTMKYTLDSLSLPTQLHRNSIMKMFIYIYNLITVTLYVLMTQNNLFLSSELISKWPPRILYNRQCCKEHLPIARQLWEAFSRVTHRVACWVIEQVAPPHHKILTNCSPLWQIWSNFCQSLIFLKLKDAKWCCLAVSLCISLARDLCETVCETQCDSRVSIWVPDLIQILSGCVNLGQEIGGLQAEQLKFVPCGQILPRWR